MQDKKDTPIYSAHHKDCSAREQISDFVVGLAERVDSLQDAEGDVGLDALHALAGSLASDAERRGFELLAELARQVADACTKQMPDAAQNSMIELTDVARRIRLGHRGSA